MGTSKNYPSPDSPRWRAVKTGYKNGHISEKRIASEVWRAASAESPDVSNMLSSEIVYKCDKIVETSVSAIDAFKAFSQEIISSKQSSIVTEFAKRAIVQSYGEGNKVENWRSNLVSEVTDYFVSRDIAGYYGKGNRNKNISELIAFKNNIREIVTQKVVGVKSEIKNVNDWKKFIDSTIARLKNND